MRWYDLSPLVQAYLTYEYYSQGNHGWAVLMAFCTGLDAGVTIMQIIRRWGEK